METNQTKESILQNARDSLSSIMDRVEVDIESELLNAYHSEFMNKFKQTKSPAKETPYVQTIIL